MHFVNQRYKRFSKLSQRQTIILEYLYDLFVYSCYLRYQQIRKKISVSVALVRAFDSTYKHDLCGLLISSIFVIFCNIGHVSSSLCTITAMYIVLYKSYVCWPATSDTAI